MANYRRVARRAARRHGLDPGVFERQIDAESSFNPHAVSPKGARGIAQIMPKTAAGWHVNPDNPRQALDAAAKHMAEDARKYGSVENALRAYNAGRARSSARTGSPRPTPTSPRSSAGTTRPRRAPAAAAAGARRRRRRR
jgi:soluble lytic murein transglycosylase-like protein